MGLLYWVLSENSELDYKQVQLLQQWFWVLLIVFMMILLFAIFLFLFLGIPIFRRFNAFKKKRAEGRLEEAPKQAPIKEKPAPLDKREIRRQEKMKTKSALYASIIALNEQYAQLKEEYSPIHSEEITFRDYELWLNYQAIDYVRSHIDLIKSAISKRSNLMEVYNAYSMALDRLLEQYKDIPEEEKAFCLGYVLPSPDFSPLFFRIKATCIGNQKIESKSLVISELNAKKMIALIANEA